MNCLRHSALGHGGNFKFLGNDDASNRGKTVQTKRLSAKIINVLNDKFVVKLTLIKGWSHK